MAADVDVDTSEGRAENGDVDAGVIEGEIMPRGHLPNTPETRRMTLGYYAMCSEVDYHFGRLMAKLSDRGVDDNTLVVFTSDHGENFGAHAAQAHRGNPQDVAVRVPLLMRMPGTLPEGRASELLFGVLDMPSTLLGLTGLDVPDCWRGGISHPPSSVVTMMPSTASPCSTSGPRGAACIRSATPLPSSAFENIERTRDISSRFGSDLPDRRRHTPNHNVFHDRETDPLQLDNLVNCTEHNSWPDQ